MENRKVFIRITNLSDDFLQIEPISLKGSSHTYDLSIELSILKTQLKEYGLNLDEDYVVNNGPYPSTRPEYKIEFRGKSQVVRALNKIPTDFINFSGLQNGRYRSENKNDLEKNKITIALKLTPKNCFVSEIDCVQQAQKTMFNNLVNDIAGIHNLNLKANSPVIKQLNDDMNTLSKREDKLFDNTNFMLLMAALHNAISEEKEKCTISTGIFVKESTLSPKYQEILVKYANHVPQLLKPTQYSNKFDPNMQNINTCYQLINPKMGMVITMNGGKK